MRLCGPVTLGEKKDRLVSIVCVPFAFASLNGVTGAFCVLEALAWEFAVRDCPVLALADDFLRL